MPGPHQGGQWPGGMSGAPSASWPGGSAVGGGAQGFWPQAASARPSQQLAHHFSFAATQGTGAAAPRGPAHQPASMVGSASVPAAAGAAAGAGGAGAPPSHSAHSAAAAALATGASAAQAFAAHFE